MRVVSVVHVMAEYFASPLWDRTPGGPYGDIELEELAISPDLADALSAWNDRYGVEPESPFEVDRVAEAWRWWNDGLHLSRRLQGELGSEVEVVYFEEEPPRP
ncbi:hypothetical protein INN71_15110 [Nocardioides sp. ChNu-153]|uniref:hypothetical protein n=1 Tax=Nocardioides sp. ChNu-153 TaxID=2779364 RepID=UPI00264CDD78|nr:hypothetical protein [Nocardioides sp. ChNu-153]MDN7122718.1 hypothetical protein [Nocardioides sp. ChNu-153]